MTTAESILESLLSTNVPGSRRGEPLNVVDAIYVLSDKTTNLADAVTPFAAPGRDATGGTVTSLTEAVMGVTAGLVQIADSINNLAEAVRECRAGS